MDYVNVDANLSFRAKIVNGQDTWTFHSSKQPGVPGQIRVERRFRALITEFLTMRIPNMRTGLYLHQF